MLRLCYGPGIDHPEAIQRHAQTAEAARSGRVHLRCRSRPLAVERRRRGHPRFRRRPGLRAVFQGFDQQIRRHALLLRGRSALHPALFGDPFQVRSADGPAATRPDRQHPRSRQFRRISPRALLSGMDAAAGVQRCRQCRAREVERELPGDDDGAVRPAHGRRRDEAPDVADRAACQPRAARQPRHQLEADAGHGARGCPGQSVIRHLPARFLAAIWCTPMRAATRCSRPTMWSASLPASS